MGEIYSEIDKHCYTAVLGIFEKETDVSSFFLFRYNSVSIDPNLLLWEPYAPENPRNDYFS